MGSVSGQDWGQDQMELAVGAESPADSASGGPQKASIPSPSIFAQSCPPAAPSHLTLMGNLGTKLSTTHGHTQHQPSRPTLTGTGPWSGLEVAGRGEEEVAL